jgi:hypothetical protein
MESPRWRLTAEHHLNVAELPDGTRVEWEHKETARESGRTVRKLYPVPMYLNPKDPADHNYPGEIIVAHKVDGCHNHPKDYVFSSPPTPEMEPLNDEAQAITDVWRHRWNNPVESLPANGGMTPAESAFMAKMMEAFERIAPPHAVPKSEPTSEVLELRERLARLEALIMSQNAKPAAGDGRRV